MLVFTFMEIWKQVNEFEKYEISNFGRLKVNLKFRKYRSYNYKILNPTPDKDGYFRTMLTSNKQKKMKTIHRLVAEHFLKNENNYPVVNHKNGIKKDNNYFNLEWCTIKHNNIHAIKLGLKKPLKWENHNMVKLSTNEILEIRKNIDNLYQWQLAMIYNISQTQISRIINNKRWIFKENNIS